MMSRQGLVEFIQSEVLAARNRAPSALNGAKFGGGCSVARSCGAHREIELKRLAHECGAASMFNLPSRFELLQHLTWKRDRHVCSLFHYSLVLRGYPWLPQRQHEPGPCERERV